MREKDYYGAIKGFCLKWNLPEVWNSDRITGANLIYEVIKVINAMIIEQKEVKELVEDFILMFDGNLTQTVSDILNEWFDSGKLADIISNEVLDMKLDKVTFEEYVTLKNIEFNNFKEENDLYHKEQEDLIYWYTPLKHVSEQNWDLAFERMNQYIKDNKGANIMLKPITYEVTKPVLIEGSNVKITGVSEKTVIKAMTGFIGDAVLIVDNNGHAFRGLNISDLCIDCNDQLCDGFQGHIIYDNSSLTNVFIYLINVTKIGFYFKGLSPQLPCQTVILTGCIAERRIKKHCETSLFYLSVCNEFTFINCKAFSGISKAFGDSVDSRESAFTMANSRQIHFYSCSCVTYYGFVIYSNGYASDSICLYSPLFEGCNGYAILSSQTGGGETRYVSMNNPVILNSVCDVHMTNANNSRIDAGSMNIEVHGSGINNILTSSGKVYSGNTTDLKIQPFQDWKNINLLNGWVGSLKYIFDGMNVRIKGIINGNSAATKYVFSDKLINYQTVESIYKYASHISGSTVVPFLFEYNDVSGDVLGVVLSDDLAKQFYLDIKIPIR